MVRQGSVQNVFRLVSKRLLCIYKDEGSCPHSAWLCSQSILDIVDSRHYHVTFIKARDIIAGYLESSDCALLVLGGGHDLGFQRALGEEGVAKIKSYVRGGGKYLGLCAGAYFACDRIEFDKGGAQEVKGDRHLNFYPGTCYGPAYVCPVTRSSKRIHPASVRYKDWFNLHAFLQGGGAFYPDSHRSNSDVTNVQVLGQFTEFQGQPSALVSCEVGEGQAVLSSVHIEFPARLMGVHSVRTEADGRGAGEENGFQLGRASDTPGPDLLGIFVESEPKRNKVLEDVLTTLALKYKTAARPPDSSGGGDSIHLSPGQGQDPFCVFKQPCSTTWGRSSRSMFIDE